ncbi:MAG: T9SS type A sorting domain-containing protein [Bacteroidetes bacterium]|nr:T9SS type A sorting domain-containing protein [Bacteroidota bacterium]
MNRLKIIILFSLYLHNTMQAQTKFGNEMCIGLHGYNLKYENPNYQHDTLQIPFRTFLRSRSNICDSTGSMILLSDGGNIYDRDGGLIENGDTLTPTSWYNEYFGISPAIQSSVFLPMVNRKYYFVTPTMNDTQFYYSKNIHPWKEPFNEILYNVIDMNANGGNGKVTKRMVPILENKEMTKTCMQACRHSNGKDWWLFKQGGDSTIGNVLYKFLFTQDSVYNMGMQIIPFPFSGYFDLWGQMAFSPDGKKWASTVCNNSDGEVYIADFDRCTGVLSNFEKKNIWPNPTGFPLPNLQADSINAGLCFSPNGKMLYVSRYSHIVQLNLQNNSQYKVTGMDTTYNYFMGYIVLQLGPDNKIYIGHKDGFSRQMNTIDNPDVPGAGCNFCKKCLQSVYKNEVLYSPPNMPNYELGADLPCWPLGIDAVKRNEEDFVVYPNPASTILYIKTDLNKVRELYNSVGQLIMSTEGNELNVAGLSQGVYCLKCSNKIRKVIIE